MNKMTINTKKCKIMRITRKRSPLAGEYNIEGQPLECVNVYKESLPFGRGSKNYSKLFSNYFLTSSTQRFTGSCLLEFPVPVFAAFGSYFCLSKTFTFPRTLRRAEHQNLALSIFTVKLFFSGPQI